jgi:hypothetical protein
VPCIESEAQNSELATQHCLTCAAGRAGGRLLVRIAFFEGQGEELATANTVADLEIRNTLIVDLGGQQEFERIIAEHGAVGKFDDCQPIVEHFKGRFLPLPLQDVTDDEHRLAPAFGPEVLESALSVPRTSKGFGLAARIGSDDRHSSGRMSIKPGYGLVM